MKVNRKSSALGVTTCFTDKAEDFLNSATISLLQKLFTYKKDDQQSHGQHKVTNTSTQAGQKFIIFSASANKLLMFSM